MNRYDKIRKEITLKELAERDTERVRNLISLAFKGKRPWEELLKK